MEHSPNTYGSMTRLAHQFQSGDASARENAAAGLWERYADRLLQMAERNLAAGVRRREDEMDVVQDAFKSFCVRHRRGDFCLSNRNQLWRLLVSITLCKARNAAERHQAARRDYRREAMPAGHGSAATDAEAWVLDRMKSAAPTPEEAAILEEQFNRLVLALPDELRSIALWKLEGYSNADIAQKLDRTERTVSRKLELIRIYLLERAGLDDE